MARAQRNLDLVISSAGRLLDWVRTLEVDPRAATVVPGWDMTTLMAHLGAVLDTTVATLGRASRSPLSPLGRYLAAYGAAGAEVADRERERAERLGWPGVLDDLDRSLTDLRAVDPARLPAKVAAPRGTLRSEDFLGTRVVELVVHADDLHRSLPGSASVDPTQLESTPVDPTPVEFTRAELTLALRTLAQALGDNHPGHTIEVRVPPYTAVQCGIPGDGPTHTRGTPPNVVETDGPTFWRLATGRIEWSEAVAGGTVSASGTRADLSTLLPLW